MTTSDSPIIKLVAIAKNEAAYIPAWVHHHFRIGIDCIEIHINNTNDNSIRICRRIRSNFPGFTFLKSDQLFQECIKKGKSFQIAAYNQSLERSRSGVDQATHLLLLDLDEFLTPKNLKGNIKKLITTSPETDVFSFLWYSDNHTGQQQAFASPFQKNLTIYRMDHVKSMAKITDTIKSCNHHNFVYQPEKTIINQLANRRDLILDDTKNTSHRRSKVNRQLLDSLDTSYPEDWYVLHCIYRSEPEYLASLCRGRGHNNDERPIKTNRWGLTPYPMYTSAAIHIKTPNKLLKKYRTSYQAFKKKTSLHRKILRARQFVLQKTYWLEEQLKKDPEVITTFQKCFEGTKFDQRL